MTNAEILERLEQALDLITESALQADNNDDNELVDPIPMSKTELHRATGILEELRRDLRIAQMRGEGGPP